MHSWDRQGKFGTFTSGFIDDQQPPCRVSLQLLIGVQEFNTVDGPVRSHIHAQFVAYPHEQIDVEPGGWLYKDTHVRMGTYVQRLTTGFFGGFSLFMNRFTGPGKVTIQSMYIHHRTR